MSTNKKLARIEGRIAYAKSLRKKSKESGKLAVWLNERLQKPGVWGYIGPQPVSLEHRNRNWVWTIFFGKHSLELTAEQMEQIFTWAMDSERKLLANAERIETELTGENDA